VAGTHTVPKERCLGVAQAPRRTFSAQGGAQGEKTANDQWTEL